MQSGAWKKRLLVALIFVLVQQIHRWLFSDLAPTDERQFIYHATAALCDFGLIVIATHLLDGQLAADIESLCYASMSTNALGWILFTAYYPPTIYNMVAGAIVYVQIFRLIWIGRNDVDRIGNCLVSGPIVSGQKLHFGATPK